MKALLPALAISALAFGQTATQKSFPSPQAAARDLVQAAASDNTTELNAIFGPHASTVLTTGNPQQDQAERAEFVKAAESQQRLQKDSMDPNRMILCVGSEDWPFPVPIVKKNGAWIFDTAMGAESMRARRIGANELDAIDICVSLGTAEQDYSEINPQHVYAPSIAALSSMIPQDFEQDEGGVALKPYHGYYFQILKAQGSAAPGGAHAYLVKNQLLGGFAIVAWPAEYGVTGVNTFVVNQDGIVFEKDLGPSHRQGAPVTTYNPDASWKPVD